MQRNYSYILINAFSLINSGASRHYYFVSIPHRKPRARCAEKYSKRRFVVFRSCRKSANLLIKSLFFLEATDSLPAGTTEVEHWINIVAAIAEEEAARSEFIGVRGAGPAKVGDTDIAQYPRIVVPITRCSVPDRL